jgi:transcriptional regulator of nitric oxide reductase
MKRMLVAVTVVVLLKLQALPAVAGADPVAGKAAGAAADTASKAEPALPWKKHFPLGESVSPASGLKEGEKAYEVRDGSGAVLGWVFRTDQVSPIVKGYNSQIGTLVALSRDGKIVDVEVLQQRETPKYYGTITGMFFKQFKGHAVSKSASDVEAVTGATVSSTAITKDVFLSAREVLKAVSPTNQPPKRAETVSP